ncbi:MAG TPA: hypothetical protein VGB17_14225 [Pyrinomonadaceae bacterium]|jgi:hypothetical protein
MSQALVRKQEPQEDAPSALTSVDRSQFMPAMSVELALERYNAITEFVGRILRRDVDYGVIPGTEKFTLLKPGAEKLTTFFGLSTRFELVERIEDWSGEEHGGEPFFYYLYRCQLWRGDVLVAESDGSCNSRETKYRWRESQRLCPDCKQAAIIKGKEEYGGGYVCFRKKGGCGAKFAVGDARIESQQVGRIANPDVADLVNTLQKMGQKRALVGTTLLAVNASEFFTQDAEDHVIDMEAVPASSPRPVNSPTSSNPASHKTVASTPVSELHRRIHEWRQKIANEEIEGWTVLNEMLGGYGCESVEELNYDQAMAYGTALKSLYNQAKKTASGDSDGPLF